MRFGTHITTAVAQQTSCVIAFHEFLSAAFTDALTLLKLPWHKMEPRVGIEPTSLHYE